MTLTAVLFAGGESRRMGVDKATLVFNGEPLWKRQLNLLRSLQPEVLRVSVRTRPAWCPLEIEVVVDAVPGRGPLSGLCAALKQMRTTHLLALAVDLPRMEAGQLQKLWALARPTAGVMPRIGENFEPLCAIYPGGDFALAAAERALNGSDVSLQSFARGLQAGNCLDVVSVPSADRACYGNVNTPEDL